MNNYIRESIVCEKRKSEDRLMGKESVKNGDDEEHT